MTKQTNIGQELSQIIERVSYKDLPQAVVLKMKQTLLDSIGCALGARITDRARIALELVAELGGNPQAVIIGGGHSSWALAAYANGELIQALDHEPCGPHSGHVVPYVLSPSLSIAQRQKASGKGLITALALALEVGSRVFNSVPSSFAPTKKGASYYEKKHPTSFGSTQVYGGVAGVSKLLQLDSKRIAHAFGIAGTNMPVPAGNSWHSMPRPSIMTKFNTLTGAIAQLSTIACLLAERGFTGDTTFLDSELGFRDVLCVGDNWKPEVITGDLGKKWWSEEWMGQWLKAYPICGIHHAAIDLIVNIMQKNHINPDNIKEILVKGGSATPPWSLPFADEVTACDCSHNDAYAYAVAAYHGQNPGPNWLMPSSYNDPKIRNLMKRVRVEAVTDFQTPIVVELTVDGKKYTATGRRQYAGIKVEQPGDTRKPLSDDEIRAKFRNNAEYSSLKSEAVERIIDAVYRLEEFDDVSEMLEMLG